MSDNQETSRKTEADNAGSVPGLVGLAARLRAITGEDPGFSELEEATLTAEEMEELIRSYAKDFRYHCENLCDQVENAVHYALNE